MSEIGDNYKISPLMETNYLLSMRENIHCLYFSICDEQSTSFLFLCEAQSQAARPSRVRNKRGTYLGQRHVGELLEGKAVLLPAVSLPLPLQDAARGHGGHAHAVTHEQDYVLGVTIGGTSGGEDVLDVSLGLGVPVVTVWGGKQER